MDMQGWDWIIKVWLRLAVVAIIVGVVIAGVLGFFAGRAYGQQIQPPLGLPITADTVACGRAMYWDTRLSINNTVACATCHHPATGYEDGRPQGVGIRNQVGTRNSPTVLNAVFSRAQFWDGRTDGMPTQSLQPLLNPIEMGNNSEQQVINRLRRMPGYQQMFAAAYGNRGITRNTVAHAFASYEARLVTQDDTPLHRRIAGDLGVLTPQQEMGYGLMLKANCFQCHSGPQFANYTFVNNGAEFALTRFANDRGRVAINGRRDRIRAFKVPSLIELERRKPYFHHGLAPDLERVVLHYSTGGMRFDGQRDREMDRRIVAQNWTADQRAMVVDVLRNCTVSPTYPMESQPALP
jgi:cytochrome c peroxidase